MVIALISLNLTVGFLNFSYCCILMNGAEIHFRPSNSWAIVAPTRINLIHKNSFRKSNVINIDIVVKRISVLV